MQLYCNRYPIMDAINNNDVLLQENKMDIRQKDCDEKQAIDEIWEFSNDHRTVHFWNNTDEWIQLTGSFVSQLGRQTSISCSTKVNVWPRKSYAWRFMGMRNLDNVTQLWGGRNHIIIIVSFMFSTKDFCVYIYDIKDDTFYTTSSTIIRWHTIIRWKTADYYFHNL